MVDDVNKLFCTSVCQLQVNLSLVRHIHQKHGHRLVQVLPHQRIDLQQQHVLFLLSLYFLQCFQEHQHVDQILLLNSLEVLDGNFVDEIVDER